MKTSFWLLDVNSEVKNDVPELWLWGIDRSDKRVLIIDRNFLSYFYAVLEEGADVGRVVEEIENEHFASVVKLEIADRKFFGRQVKTVKVYCRNPDVISKHAKSLRKIEGIKDCLEDDIRYTMRYLIDNNVVPCGWHEVEAVEEPNTTNAQVNKVFAAKSAPRLIEEQRVPELKTLGFSIVCYSREGSPKADRNPVIMISAATNDGDEKQFLAGNDKNDKLLLEKFIKYVRDNDPDVIAGYGTNGLDWPYLKARCKKHGLQLRVDRAGTEPHTSVYGHVSVTGRASIDLLDYVGEFPEVKVQTLQNLADYLGLMKIESREIIEEVDFPDYWDDKEKHKTLLEYSKNNTHSVLGISDAVLDFAVQLSNLVILPLDHVGTAAAGFRVEWFLIKHTHEIGELIPKRIEQPYRPYAGGVVLKPVAGLHENVAVLDFKSMYPNLMINYNMSPDTYVSPQEALPPSEVYEAPEVKHRFRKNPPGFYKEILSYLIRIRDEIRSRMKSISPKNVEYRVLDARQKAVKVITNATYGYAGWVGARWYSKPVAEAAAAWGRDTIQTAVEMAKDAGLRVVYGDTDSIFLTNDPAKIDKLTKGIMKMLGLEIKSDKTYLRVFFTEAKKRYAGLLQDGQLDIVGMEVVRGDWAGIAKTVQERVLEIILKEKSAKKAVDFVQQFVNELRQKRIPYRDLIIWKTLSKPVEEYEVKASHVEAAKLLMKKGWKMTAGDKIGYVVVAGTGRLHEHVKPYMLASYDDIDLDYYVSKQIVPAAARVLESFGISEDQLLPAVIKEGKTRRITDFFGD